MEFFCKKKMITWCSSMVQTDKIAAILYKYAYSLFKPCTPSVEEC